jgi:fucose permease
MWYLNYIKSLYLVHVGVFLLKLKENNDIKDNNLNNKNDKISSYFQYKKLIIYIGEQNIKPFLIFSLHKI